MLAVVAGLSAPAGTASAISADYISPFPSHGKYTMFVLGDSLGVGLAQGLKSRFSKDADIRVIRKSKGSTGLVRRDYHDWIKISAQIAASGKADIAVILIGGNDRQGIREDGHSYRFGTDQWRQHYAGRVDRVIASLKGAGAAIYWVEVPTMKPAKFRRDMALLNRIFRARAAAWGVKFVDTWQHFSDQDGNYSAYGTGLGGRKQRMRGKDGIHFTGAGYRKLAHIVERGIRQDLSRGREIRKQLQRMLAKRGYLDGTADGIIGERTRAAIRAYQSDHGMAVSGRANAKLLASLGVGPAPVTKAEIRPRRVARRPAPRPEWPIAAALGAPRPMAPLDGETAPLTGWRVEIREIMSRYENDVPSGFPMR